MNTNYTINYEPVLREMTNIRLGGVARILINIETKKGFEEIPTLLKKYGGELRAIGGGSNIIAKDGHLPYFLVNVSETSSLDFLDKDETSMFVSIPSFIRMPLLLKLLSDKGLSGLEGLAGIPGRAGGAFAMNAGSYNAEFCRYVESVNIFTPEKGLHSVPASSFNFAYRKVELLEEHEWFIVESIVLCLKKDSSEKIKQRIKENMHQKKSTQPVSERSAGCVFKNPTSNSAGKLLDAAGFRGRKCGGMCFSDIHANFLINLGEGTFAEAEELIKEAQEAVLNKFNIKLELEAKIW